MGLTNNTGKLSNTLTSNGTQITLGGSTVTDGNLLNIIGNQSTVNVGVVLNNTNGTYPKIYGLQNVNNNFVLYDYSASATRLTIGSTGAATFSSSVTAVSLIANQAAGGVVGSFGSSAATNTYTRYIYNNADYAYLGNGPSIFSGAGATDLGITTAVSSSLLFGTNNTERMRITNDGNVLIAQTVAPTASAGTIMMLSNTIFFNYTSGVSSPYNQSLRVDIVWNNWGGNNVVALVDVDFLAREWANLGGVSFGRIYALSSAGATTFNNTINTTNVTTANATLTASSPANFMLRLLFTPTNQKDVIGCFIRIPIGNAGTGTTVASITATLV